MYTGILHTHIFASTLFLLYYLVRWALLMTNKEAALAKLVKVFKVPDMIISFLFLATGIYLSIFSGVAWVGSWLIVKIIAVLASIPLAVIGFKKKNKALATVSILLLIYAYGLGETKSATMNKASFYENLKAKSGVAATKLETDQSIATDPVKGGEILYNAYCKSCHGENGEGGISGAKDLTKSTLLPDQSLDKIRNGKNAMPGFGKALSEDELLALNAYIHTRFVKTQNIETGHTH